MKNFVPLPIKLLKVYLPTPFCKFFSKKWNIPSLIASFRGCLDGTFAEKFIFPTNHTWRLKECQMIFKKSKKSADRYSQCLVLIILQDFHKDSTGLFPFHLYFVQNPYDIELQFPISQSVWFPLDNKDSVNNSLPLFCIRFSWCLPSLCMKLSCYLRRMCIFPLKSFHIEDIKWWMAVKFMWICLMTAL